MRDSCHRKVHLKALEACLRLPALSLEHLLEAGGLFEPLEVSMEGIQTRVIRKERLTAIQKEMVRARARAWARAWDSFVFPLQKRPLKGHRSKRPCYPAPIWMEPHC